MPLLDMFLELISRKSNCAAPATFFGKSVKVVELILVENSITLVISLTRLTSFP